LSGSHIGDVPPGKIMHKPTLTLAAVQTSGLGIKQRKSVEIEM